jgi:ABC-type amino acid transport substrate-binding protein
VARTPGAEPEFVWVGPIAKSRLVVFSRADDPVTITGPADLKGRRIGVLRGSEPQQWLTEQGIEHGAVADGMTSFKMLNLKRIDLWAANERVAHYVVQGLGGPPPKVVFVIREVENYLACHRSMGSDTIARLNLAVERLARKGELAQFGIR